jgi:DNA modification methylase
MNLIFSTTGVAANNLNRSFIGRELDETYFNIAKDRILGKVII